MSITARLNQNRQLESDCFQVEGIFTLISILEVIIVLRTICEMVSFQILIWLLVLHG